MAAEIRRIHPKIQVVVGDCQERLDFPDGKFDRVLAVHVLEHLPNLPAAVRELYRLVDKQRGQFEVVIPSRGRAGIRAGAQDLGAAVLRAPLQDAVSLAHRARAHQRAARDPRRARRTLHHRAPVVLSAVRAIGELEPRHGPHPEAAVGVSCVTS